MYEKRQLTGLTIVACLMLAGPVWAGGGAGSPEVREQFLEHICKAGPNKGQPCTVSLQGGVLVSEECPNKCMIDYQSKTFRAEICTFADDDAAPFDDPGTANGLMVTVSIRIKAAGEVHRFTEVYTPNGAGHIAIPGFSFALGEQSMVNAVELLGPIEEAAWLLFGVGSLFTPEGDLAEAMRQALGVVGMPIPVVAKTGTKVEFSDHVADETGSTFCLKNAKIRFVNPILGP